MNYYIWDKKESIMGLSAQTLFASRPDFNHDIVIVIHKKDNKQDVVMIETLSDLRETYDILSEDPIVVGYIVSLILSQEHHKTIKEQLQVKDEEREDEDNVETYMKILEDLLNCEPVNIDGFVYDEPPIVPLAGSYQDPECKVIDLSDVDESVHEKVLQIVIKHAFLSESIDLENMKLFSTFYNELEALEKEREQLAIEGNLSAVETLTHKIETLKLDVMDTCDATIKVNAKVIYEYDTSMFVECENGQTIIIDKEVLDLIKTSSIEYEKNINGDKRRVHYKTVNLVLNECYNEIIERNDSVFIISIC